MQRYLCIAPVFALIGLTVTAGCAAASAKPNEAAYDKAYALMKANKCNAAVPLFEQYIAGVPRSDYYDRQSADINAGNCYYQTSHWADAARRLDEAMMLVPYVNRQKGRDAGTLLPVMYYDAADAHLRLAEYGPAVTDVTKGFQNRGDVGLSIDSDDAFAYSVRGTAYLRMAVYSKALSDLNASLKLDPRDFMAHLSRGEALRALGNYKGSIDDFIAANKANKNSGYPYCEAGLTLILQHRDSTARSAFDRCFQIDPSLRAHYFPLVRSTLANRH
jgi:tetratricopeptide (TPR) repeat protein